MILPPTNLKCYRKWIQLTVLCHWSLFTLPEKKPENQRFSDILRGYRKIPVPCNRLLEFY